MTVPGCPDCEPLPVRAVTNAGPKPLVYVAGPITGNPFGCVRQAVDAFRWLRKAGTVPFLPQLSVLHEMVQPEGYEEWLAYDFDVLERCDALVRLPGESPGADREVVHARSLRLPIFYVHEDPEPTALLVAAWVSDRSKP